MTSRKKEKAAEVGETTHDAIGFWSEIKLDILKKYWPEYTKIVKKQSYDFYTLYVDAFAGSGEHTSRTTGEVVAGSPLRALGVEPPFDEYHFIEIDDRKVEKLEELAATRSNAHVHHGDCNDVLTREVLPLADYKRYRRAVCLLDPYSLQLDWEVMRAAGQMKSVEIFLNFPIMDMNRNVFRRGASAPKENQMTRFWGDDSWRSVAFREQPLLFGTEMQKAENHEIVTAFSNRLREVAGFEFVPEPLAMRNSAHATVYYLFFAGNNKTGARIVDWIFNDYRDKGYG
jgi:three-Cys-motif partner protein